MITYKVRLTKVESSHNNLRTDIVEGITTELPSVGKSFNLVGEPLASGAFARLVYTTEIKMVENIDDEYLFRTLNSTYKIKVLETFHEKS